MFQDGRAREAAEWYVSLVPGSRIEPSARSGRGIETRAVPPPSASTERRRADVLSARDDRQMLVRRCSLAPHLSLTHPFRLRFGALRLVLVAICAGAVASTGSATVRPHGWVAGRVMLGPTCPVVRADHPCPDRPLAIRLDVRTSRGGLLVASTRSRRDGRFRLGLPVGEYRLMVVGRVGLPGVTHDWPLAVRAGKTTVLQLHVDSGIR